MKRLIFFLLILSLAVLSCINSPFVTIIKGQNPRINSELSAEGNIIHDDPVISPDAKKIYFEFYLDIPENMEVPLNFIWFFRDGVIQRTSNKLPGGDVMVTLERDSSTIQEFQIGVYRVEVWYLNTLIVSKYFEIK
jgi:hypothetical protein